jgi:probable phosphoglycerate mutase
MTNPLRNRYFIMRHGLSLSNEQRVIVSSPDNGIPGYGLTKTGKDQVRQAIRAFRGLDADTRIVCSDFLRTRETAGIVARHLRSRHTIMVSSLLRERYFGSLELCSADHYQEVWDHDAGRPPLAVRGIEKIKSVLNRMLACVDELEHRFENEVILLVSHGDPLQIFLAYIKGMDPRIHWQINPLETAQIQKALPR